MLSTFRLPRDVQINSLGDSCVLTQSLLLSQLSCPKYIMQRMCNRVTIAAKFPLDLHWNIRRLELSHGVATGSSVSRVQFRDETSSHRLA